MGKAAAEAEMNILHHMGWSGDKAIPETLEELNINEIGPDIVRYNACCAGLPAQRQAFEKAYGP